ncbi:hypothetical protein MD484_g2119, partial [Candolleomyces efflorescens]
MLLILSLLSAIYLKGSCAPVLPTSSSETFDTNGDIRFITNYRSTPGIIWTCFATTLLCTWVSIHPDIVGYNSSKWERFKARFRWFLLALFAPELALVWAAFQWKLANDIAHHFGKHRPRGWKRMRKVTKFIFKEPVARFIFGEDSENDKHLLWKPEHGHFLLMGGVIFSFNNQEPKYLKLRKLLENRQSNDAPPTSLQDQEIEKARERLAMELPSTSKTIELRDRSKGDAITKGITFLQTFWFIVQIIARRVQNLDVTALEVVTLAYAVTTLIAYIFWWNKPLHVQNPIVIDVDLPPRTAAEGKMGTQGLGPKANNVGDGTKGGEDRITEKSPVDDPKRRDEFIPYEFSKSWSPMMRLALLHPIERTGPPPSEGLTLIFNGIVVYLVLALLAVPGSFYYIAWNFTFPKLPIGRILWRVACVVNTALPVSAALFGILVAVLGLVWLIVYGLYYLFKLSTSRSPPNPDEDETEASEIEVIPVQLGAGVEGHGGGQVGKAEGEGDDEVTADKERVKDSETKQTNRILGRKVLAFIISFLYFSSRLILTCLALWDLSDLPSDAHETVSWSRFVPHF